MRKSLFALCFIFFSHTMMSQFTIGLNGGLGSTRRDIPKGNEQRWSCAGVALDIEYKFDSIPIVLNLSPYFITQTRFEQSAYSQHIVSIYDPEFIIMGGLGTSASVSRFIQLYASLQFGYWYTENKTIIHDINYSEEKIYRNLNQFSLGPKVRITLGKGRLKTVFEYEDHLLTPGPEKYANYERFSRLSLGLLYSFK